MAVTTGYPQPKEALLARTLVGLAGSLAVGVDLVELLTDLADRCVEVLDVAAAGVMIGYPGGDLRVMASSSEAMRLLELFELQSAEGPCPDCYRTGEAIVNRHLTTEGGPWPRFGPRAVEAGFKSVHALPMRAGNVTIGALNLFRADEGALDDIDVVAAQALADVATIAILQHRDTGDTTIVDEQLRRALGSRIVIEQAKGMVAEDACVDTDQAFCLLREHARRANLLLVDVARKVIAGVLLAGSLGAVAGSPPPGPGADAAPLPQTASVLAGTDLSRAQLRAETLSMLGAIAVDGQSD